MSSITTKPSEAPNSTEERRSSPRRRFERLTYAEFGPDNGGILIDISENGSRFQSVEPVVAGEMLPIRFVLTGSVATIKAAAKVIWCNESGKGGGLRFVNLSEPARHQIGSWVAADPDSVPGPAGAANGNHGHENGRAKYNLLTTEGQAAPPEPASDAAAMAMARLLVSARGSAKLDPTPRAKRPPDGDEARNAAAIDPDARPEALFAPEPLSTRESTPAPVAATVIAEASPEAASPEPVIAELESSSAVFDVEAVESIAEVAGRTVSDEPVTIDEPAIGEHAAATESVPVAVPEPIAVTEAPTAPIAEVTAELSPASNEESGSHTIREETAETPITTATLDEIAAPISAAAAVEPDVALPIETSAPASEAIAEAAPSELSTTEEPAIPTELNMVSSAPASADVAVAALESEDHSGERSDERLISAADLLTAALPVESLREEEASPKQDAEPVATPETIVPFADLVLLTETPAVMIESSIETATAETIEPLAVQSIGQPEPSELPEVSRATEGVAEVVSATAESVVVPAIAVEKTSAVESIAVESAADRAVETNAPVESGAAPVPVVAAEVVETAVAVPEPPPTAPPMPVLLAQPQMSTASAAAAALPIEKTAEKAPVLPGKPTASRDPHFREAKPAPAGSYGHKNGRHKQKHQGKAPTNPMGLPSLLTPAAAPSAPAAPAPISSAAPAKAVSQPIRRVIPRWGEQVLRFSVGVGVGCCLVAGTFVGIRLLASGHRAFSLAHARPEAVEAAAPVAQQPLDVEVLALNGRRWRLGDASTAAESVAPEPPTVELTRDEAAAAVDVPAAPAAAAPTPAVATTTPTSRAAHVDASPVRSAHRTETTSLALRRPRASDKASIGDLGAPAMPGAVAPTMASGAAPAAPHVATPAMAPALAPAMVATPSAPAMPEVSKSLFPSMDVPAPERRASNFRAPVLLEQVNPIYPAQAKEQHITGTVRLDAIVGREGIPHSLRVMSGDPRLAPAAIAAVSQWLYQPAQLNGEDIDTEITIDVQFQIR